ncbi:MAG: ABC transporter substrate-binding protein [Desulfobacterales bacterium]|nr:ABC transporter substrate-binding protein [Desulfobacterales bacterium]MDD4392834.1 ABC transporter substrate-binding protein [Desulfobacterales bacterium]
MQDVIKAHEDTIGKDCKGAATRCRKTFILNFRNNNGKMNHKTDRKKKRSGTLIFISAICAIFFILLGLRLFNSFPQLPEPAAQKSRLITDMRGREVVIPDPLKKIALLGGPTGQVAYILSVQDQLCAVTNTLKMSRLIREMDPGIKDLPGPRTVCGNINIEELIESMPDIVIAGDIDGDIVLKKTRIPVVFLDDSMGEGIDDVIREIRFYGYVFCSEDRAERYVDHLKSIIRRVRARTADIPENERKKVFHGYNPTHLVTLGGDTFMQERIEFAGCINSSESVATTGKQTGLHSGLGEVSMEQVLEWNPDIIVINSGSPEDLAGNPQWRSIAAVQNKQIYCQPAGVFIFNRPTAESAALYPLWLAAVAYPDRFSDISLKKEIKNFYRDIFDFELTEEQVHKILAGDYEAKIMKGAQL